VHHTIKRRNTPQVTIGGVTMGSDSPVRIQSMTNTPTSDIKATLTQVKELINAGSELVRLTVNDFEAADAIPEIIKQLSDQGFDTPIIGDFHYNGHVLLSKYPKAAALLAKYRINPGNVGKGKTRDDNFATLIKIALDNNKPVRIGVNWGSLDQDIFTDLMNTNAKRKTPKSFKEVVYDAMLKSAINSAEYAQKLGMPKDKIVLSVKMSELQDMVSVYEQLAKKSDYVLHLGLTEAGSSLKGTVSSAAALAILLQKGIGDTIRISLTPEPNVSRDLEVKACKNLLQSLGLRYFMPSVTSCPGCGRTNSDKFIYLAKDITEYIEKKMPEWKKNYLGVEMLTIAVMGCVVNGPGESKYANIGISLPGSSEKPSIPVYKDGELFKTFKGDSKTIKEDFIELVETYIKEKYS